MADGPSGRRVPCPECGGTAIAVVPKNAERVENEENADGMVWANCHTCGERLRVYYR